MKDLDTWFYVIIFIFYVGAQIMKGLKKAKQSHPAQQPTVPDAMPVGKQGQPRAEKKRKRFSFDDLLNEFEKGFEQEKQPKRQIELPPEIPEEPVPDYSGQLHNEPEYVSPVDNDKPLLKEDQSVPESNRDINYKIKVKEKNIFAEILSEPDGVRKAIILSEILNRKYV